MMALTQVRAIQIYGKLKYLREANVITAANNASTPPTNMLPNICLSF
jgi:hypothetical protein